MQKDRKHTALDEAAEWYFRRDAGAWSPQEEARFAAWLKEDPEHQTAYHEIASTWAELGAVPLKRKKSRTLWHTAGRQIIAASAAALCVLALAFGFDLPMRLEADAYTNTGETKSLALEDGSSVILDTASAISIRFTHEARRVEVLRGEVVFNVAHDTLRPFLVEAGGGEAKAFGTAFSVRKDEEGATVTVLESRVGVAYPATTAFKTALDPNEQVHYTRAGIGPIEAVDSEALTAWRRGKLIFINRTLGSVVGELNRYHAGLIKITDLAIMERRVSGVFETRDPVAALNSIETTLGLHSTRLTPYLILLHE